MVKREGKALKIYNIIAFIVSVILIIVTTTILLRVDLFAVNYILFYPLAIGFTIYSLIMCIYSLAKNKEYIVYTIIASIISFIGVLFSLIWELGQVKFILWPFFAYLIIFFYSLYMLWRK